MDYASLIANNLLDENFPYPEAFETAYNLATKLLDSFQFFNNLLMVIVVILVLVLITKILWMLIR